MTAASPPRPRPDATLSSRLRKIARGRWFLTAASLLLVLGVWELLGRQRPVFASYPLEILQAATKNFVPDVIPAFIESAVGFVIGFGIAVVFGVAIGLAMARSRLIDLSLSPYMNAMYATPRIALIPILILWFGIAFELRVVIVVLSAIFPIIINTYIGAREVDKEMLDIGRVFTADKWQQLRTIVFPGSLPFIYAGERSGLARALSGIIVAEMTASITGVGRLIIDYSKYLQTDSLFVALLTLGFICLILTSILDLIKRKTMPWIPEVAK